jgi:SAM-dependent methyltransferase
VAPAAWQAGAPAALVQASADALPFTPASFDLVISTVSFHHWNSQRAGIAEAGGCFVLADLARRRLPAGVLRAGQAPGPDAHPARDYPVLAAAGDLPVICRLLCLAALAPVIQGVHEGRGWRVTGRPGSGRHDPVVAKMNGSAKIVNSETLPVCFLVSSWPASLGRASVVATRIASRRGASVV